MAQDSKLISPSIIPIFRIWLLFIIALFVLSPTDIAFEYRAAVAVLYPLLFALPLFGYRADLQRRSIRVKYTPIPASIGVIMVAASAVFVAVCIQFYTGQNALTAVISALSGRNTYGIYQEYFRESNIAQMPVTSRATFVLLLAFAKISYIYLTMNLFLSADRSYFRVALATAACALYVSFGLARGTFFEVFEIACAVLYFWFGTSIVDFSGIIKRSNKVFVVAGIAGVVLTGLFILNAMRRYDDAAALFDQCSPNFCLNAPSSLSFISQPLFMLTVYFGNGAYFFAKLVETTFIEGRYLYLLPMQSIFTVTNPEEFGVRGFMCGHYVACRFVWSPEVATLISIFGFFTPIATNLGVMLLGKYERFAIRNFSRARLALSYFVFVFVVSLPVANFYTVSTPSIVASIALLAWIVFVERRRSARLTGV